jgi:hypothetical protein
MITIGIIANPASGKDIRRLVAHGSVFDNDEKVNIVRRLLLALDSLGIERIWIMPDRFGIGYRALDGLRLGLTAEIFAMPTFFAQEDSTRAARLMAERGARCLITLGGDGTNRAVAKGCGDLPLLPISTGTNNVFPYMIEATVAGLAAGLVARGLADEAIRQLPRLDIDRCQPDGQPPERAAGSPPEEIALVDAALYDEPFIAARAVWEGTKIRELVLTRAEPGSIGLSAIGAHLLGGDLPSDHGLYLRLGEHGRPVQAPIAPGLIQTLYVTEFRRLAPGDAVTLSLPRAGVIAVDGEREIELQGGQAVRLRLNRAGPRVIDPRQAIALAARAGAFGQAASTRPL